MLDGDEKMKVILYKIIGWLILLMGLIGFYIYVCNPEIPRSIENIMIVLFGVGIGLLVYSRSLKEKEIEKKMNQVELYEKKEREWNDMVRVYDRTLIPAIILIVVGILVLMLRR